MPEKILVVDDEQDIADLLEVYLQNENYTVYKFYSAREALDCIEKQEIDTTKLITHRFNFDEIETAYRIFENKLDGVIKVAVKI